MSKKASRRDFLGQAMLGAAGVGAASVVRTSPAAADDHPPAPPAQKPNVDPSRMPMAKIGKVTMSRLMMGGNLIAGFSHSRDLAYLSRLFKGYNTQQKVFETLAVGEQCGINIIQVNTDCFKTVERYWQERKSKLQALVCVKIEGDAVSLERQIKDLADRGVAMLYTHGESSDQCVRTGQIDKVERALELIHKQGLSAGVGSHSLETTMACEKANFGADFYVKTFHNDNYWSAPPKDKRVEWCWYLPEDQRGGFHDNMWCLDVEKTTEFMETVTKPWIAFKVMAAGAIHPRMAFSHAFRHGADVILAGMFDFQIEQDAKIAIDAAQKHADRKRPWRA